MVVSRSRRDLRVATLTGGTGGFNLARGFRDLAVGKITAIYTVCDNGGSTGRLRTEQGVLPVGDARRLVKALMDPKHPLAPFMDFRFPDDGTSLAGQSLMNIFLTASEVLYGREGGTQYLANAFGSRGEVYPISTNDCNLIAELSDGEEVFGETVIDTRGTLDERYIMRVRLDRRAYISQEADRAIREADVVVLGPGDLYTSIIPLLLVDGVAEALASSPAKLVYIVNLMTKYAETRGFSAKDFVELPLKKYGIGRSKFDAVLVHDLARVPIPQRLLDKYFTEEKAEPVMLHERESQSLYKDSTHRVVVGDFVSERAVQQGLIHHDGTKLAHAVMGLMEPSLPADPRAFIFDLDDTLANTTKDMRGDVLRISKLTLVSGARQLLTELAHAGHRRELVTMGDRDYQMKKLEIVGIADSFDGIHFVETREEKKGALERLVKEIGLPPQHVIVVGDHPSHELCYARDLGCKVLRVKLGHGKYREVPCVPEPDLTVDTFVDLPLQRLY